MREKVLRMQSISYSQDSLYFFYKIISTHLLTVLIMRVIVHTEQRKREKRNLPEKVLTEFADVFRNSKLKTPAQHAANIDQEE